MALNDYADRAIDAQERPHRPIPSGKISPRGALLTSVALTATGIGISSATGGRRALAGTVPLAASIWAYDLCLKKTRFGVASMALARFADVLIAAGPAGWRDAAPPAAIVAGHTFAVTEHSRREVEGSSRVLPMTGLAATGMMTVCAAALRGPRGHGDLAASRGVTAMALAHYAQSVGSAQFNAIGRPSPARLQRAVGAGILGLIPLQAALAARYGAWGAAVPLGAGLFAARVLSRKVNPT
jgi:4-hydroxybenzoate polyprenyltransferase